MTRCKLVFPLFSFLLAICVLPSCSRNDADPVRAAEKQGKNPQNAERGGAESTGGFMSGSNAQPKRGPVMTFERPPVTEIREVVDSNHREAFWTRAADLHNVIVQRVLTNRRYILVGPDANHELLVRLQELRPQLKTGESIDIRGIINQLGVDLSQWNLTPAEQKLLGGFDTFLLETRAETTQ